jgi:TPR repeat protein
VWQGIDGAENEVKEQLGEPAGQGCIGATGNDFDGDQGCPSTVPSSMERSGERLRDVQLHLDSHVCKALSYEVNVGTSSDASYSRDGAREDKEEAARRWYGAAEQGHTVDKLELAWRYFTGDGVREGKEEAVRWWRAAAEQDDAVAKSELARCYYHGHGVREDKEEAVRWFRAAAEQGRAVVKSELAHCYAKGDGVREDKEEACAQWWGC